MKLSLRAAAVAFVAMAAVPLGCAGARPGLSLDDGCFRLAGLSAADLARPGEELLVVRVAGSPTPLFGTYRVDAGILSFEPRFPLKPGVEYRASAGGEEQAFRLPDAPASAPTFVRAVFPSADVLPENLLKFYLHFSAPMSRREAYRRVHLKDALGRDVELPFLELGEELWDREGLRITLLFDPGRIKRGLKPREDSGPALEEGKSYTLVIDAAWPDAEGRPLREEFRKPFRVAPPDDKQPDSKAWSLEAPHIGSTEPLVVSFDEPLDEAMLHRSLAPRNPADDGIEGRIEIERGELRWRFFPVAPWKPGAYTLRVDTLLEDRCGNSLERPFEVDVVRPVERSVTTRTLAVPFTPR